MEVLSPSTALQGSRYTTETVQRLLRSSAHIRAF